MTIQQCKYVIAIARLGSFTEAAKQLFIAQSGLSSSVKQLEAELGIKIFERSKNGVCLSTEGAEFLRFAEGLVSESEFIIDNFRQSKEKNRLHISSQHYDFVADVFCEIIKDDASKRYDYSLCEKKTFEVISDVECGSVDIGILAIKDGDIDVMLRYLGKLGLSFFEIVRARAHAYMRTGHPLSNNKTVSYTELAHYPFISYVQGDNSNSVFREEMSEFVTQERSIAISDRATLMNALMATDGYTTGTGIMPSLLNDGRIISIPLSTDEKYHIGYIIKGGDSMNEACKLFIERLREFTSSKTNDSLT